MAEYPSQAELAEMGAEVYELWVNLKQISDQDLELCKMCVVLEYDAFKGFIASSNKVKML